MRILIATVQVPFVRGGAEILAERLRQALCAEGHQAEIAAIPFRWYPPERILDHMLACRLLDITESEGVAIDLVIGLKFPAYLIPHPNKILWILHQHRSAYDLWSSALSDLIHFPNGTSVRDAIHLADYRLIPEAKAIFTISANVSSRLKTHCDIPSTPLYHPPDEAEQFYCDEAESYFFFPSRLNPTKRQTLVLEALVKTQQPVRVRFTGSPEQPTYADELRKCARKLGLAHRTEWLGHVSNEEKRRQYARALGVVYPPLDEDYGYVTLEAMLASKPVITCTDSGGTLEFVQHEKTGLIAEPTPMSLAKSLDALWINRVQARSWGQQGRAHYDSLNITWSHVVETLLS